MYVFSLLKEVQICLPAYHQVMAAVKGTHSSGIKLICITDENVHYLASHHCGERYARTIGSSYIQYGGVKTVSTSY